MFDIWSEDNDFLNEDYKKSNIKIKTNNKAKSNICLIFCSGNGLYFPNTEKEYINKIRKNDRYEWENIAKNRMLQKYVAKMIFIRDIYKQWYVTGINFQLYNIDILVEYLRKETIGYQVVTVGNSAGGYMATLLGVLLNAFRIITISGQYNLWGFINNKNNKNLFLEKYKECEIQSKYYDLRMLLKNSTVPVLYFFPCNCREDVEQYEIVKEYDNILPFLINSNQHGAGVNSVHYPFLFTCNSKELEKIYLRYKNCIIEPNKFYTKLSSFISLYYLKNITIQILRSFFKIIMRQWKKQH
jgi:hypothetical protein